MVSDDVVEEEEEDLEVAKIYNEAKDKHRKIMTGMYNLQYNACYSCRRRQRYKYKCNALNSMLVGEVGDTSMYL